MVSSEEYYRVERINETIKQELEEENTRTESGFRESKLEPSTMKNKKSSKKH